MKRTLIAERDPPLMPFISTNYKDALKYGFYELQGIRDWYREVTSDIGMHGDLALRWIRTAALLVTPIAPHFAEHIYSTVLKNPTSVQLALWPKPTNPVDQAIIDAGQYMRETIKTIRDAEISLLKMMSKNKGKKGTAVFDPKSPKAVRIYVATKFPEWQTNCVQFIQQAYDEQTHKVDDEKVRALLVANGLIKDKRAMPFIQAFKVRVSQFLPWPLLIDCRNAFPSLGHPPSSTELCPSRRRASCQRFCHT